MITASKKYGDYRTYIMNACLKYNRKIPTIMNWTDAVGKPVKARINHGRWIADCECGEAVMYEPGEYFFCPLCMNQATGGRARPVEMPDNVQEIEAILLARPTENQNWQPGETLEFLRQENEEHGL